jgi:hypothetical protein
MSYQGIFIRDYVGELPDGPLGTSWTNSPDLFCNGTSPIIDISSLTNQTNYLQGLPNAQVQVPLQQNYVYIRGINTVDGSQTSTIYFYYVDTSIVLWPQNWKTANVMIDNKEQNWVKVTASQLNQIVTGDKPFIWTPPRQGIHYCIVGWVKNGADQDTPPDLYSIGAVNDMANFILTHPNVGWKNTIEVDATQPTIQNSSPIIGPADGGSLNIGIQCQNLPTDGKISFSVQGPDAANTINVVDLPIRDVNMAVTVKVTWPANYQSTLVFSYFKGAKNPPDGANIIPIVGTMGTGADFIELVSNIAPKRLVEGQHFESPDHFGSNSATQIPPSKLFIVGSVPFKLIQ